jgi:hypothetical protein
MSIVTWCVDHAAVVGPAIGYVLSEAVRMLDAERRRIEQEEFDREARKAEERRYPPPADMTGPHR